MAILEDRLRHLLWRSIPTSTPLPRARRQIVGWIYRAAAPLPAVNLDEGDFLVLMSSSKTPRSRELTIEASWIRELADQMPRRFYPYLQAHLDAIAAVDDTWLSLHGADGIERLDRFLGNGAALRGRDATSPLWIVRAPFTVEAATDEAAAQALLEQVAGAQGAGGSAHG